MNIRSIRLHALVIPVLAVGMLQLGGCTRQATIKPAPPGGVYRSNSAGASFDQSVNIAGEPGQYVADYKMHSIFRVPGKPDEIYVAAGDRGLIESKDDGQSWRVIKTPLSQTLDALVLPNSAIIASGTDEKGQGFIIRSLDLGLSWQTVLTVPVPVQTSQGISILQNQAQVGSVVLDLEADPLNGDRVYAGSNLGTIFAGEQSAKVWKTVYNVKTSGIVATAGGENLAISKLVPSPHTAGEVLVVTKSNELFRINQSGQAEIEVPQYINEPVPLAAGQGQKKVYDVAYIQQFPQALLIGVEDGVVVTRDGGQSWVQLGLPIETSQAFNSIEVAASPTNTNRLLTAINNVVYRSEDGGQTWNTYSLGLPNHIITGLTINPSNAAKVLVITNPLTS